MDMKCWHLSKMNSKIKSPCSGFYIRRQIKVLLVGKQGGNSTALTKYTFAAVGYYGRVDMTELESRELFILLLPSQ